MPTPGMTWHELPPRNPAPPRIVDYSQEQPPPPAVPPGLRQTLTIMPQAVARATFEEMSGRSRKIPNASDEVLIRPGRDIGVSSTFELPRISETDGVADNKKLEILTLTNGVHKIISNDLIDGRGEITLDGMGSNVRLRVIAGKWVVLGMFKAEVK